MGERAGPSSLYNPSRMALLESLRQHQPEDAAEQASLSEILAFVLGAGARSGAPVGRFSQGLSRATELPDGTPVTEVLTASGVRGGDTVRCAGAAQTQVWVAQDGSARGAAGVAALVAAPLLAVGATVLLVVGLAARRRP